MVCVTLCLCCRRRACTTKEIQALVIVSAYVHIFQVQNLNNIMAFPLENVLKSELRDSRLVSIDFMHTQDIDLFSI